MTQPGTQLVVTPHPLTLAGQRVQLAELRPGESLQAFLGRAGVDVSEPGWVVSIGGATVHPLMYGRTRPRHGQMIEVRRVPGRDTLRLAALIVLAIYAPQIGAMIGASSFANAAVYVIGSLIINRVLGPARVRLPTFNTETGTTYSLAGQRNRMRPYEPLGLLYGTTRFVPDLAAQPYSWFAGDEQYQVVRLAGGLNCDAVSELRIGLTPLGSYDDVEVFRAGFPSGNTSYIDWGNVDTIAGATLSAPALPSFWVQRTSSPNTTSIALDFSAQLYDMDGSGNMATATLTIGIDTAPAGSGIWVPQPDLVITSRSTRPARRTVTIDFGSPGQWDVRCRKLTEDVSTARSANAVDWVALKSYQVDTRNLDHYPELALRIRATGQLQGVLDEVSWLGVSEPVPVWTGSAWVTQRTSNPGAHMLAFARGHYDSTGRRIAGMGLPDAQIDIEALQGFMVHCATNGYTFDHYFDASLSCYEMLEAMAAVGLGSVSQHTGRLGVVWLASGQPLQAVINMGNIKAGGFRVEHALRDTADEVEVQYFDAASDYEVRSVRLKAPGVDVPRETARLAPVGVRSQAGAVRMGRLAMAQTVYQRRSVSWEMDLEHLCFNRYSLVSLSHDLTRWGYGGRVSAATAASGTVTLQLDDEVPTASARYIGLRIPGETAYRVFPVQAFTGTTRTVVLASAWPSGVPLPGSSDANPAHDTLWIYDFKAEPGIRLRVTDIEPNDNLSGARITAVPEPGEFWYYMATGVYTPVAVSAARDPAGVANLRVVQRRLDVNYGNSTELQITWDATGNFHSAQVFGALVGDALQLLGTTPVPVWGPVSVGNDGIYRVRVLPLDDLGRAGAAVELDWSITLGAVLGGGSTAAQLLTLLATSQVFKFSGAGAASPSGQVITLSAQLANLSGTATWGCTLYDAAGASLGAGTLGGSGNTRTLAVGDFGAAAYAEVTATLGLYSDRTTIWRVQDGGEAISGYLTNQAHSVATAADGSGGVYTGAGGRFVVTRGAAVLTSGVTFEVVSSAGISGLAIDAAGDYTLTGTTADTGTATLRATVGSVVVERQYSISRSRQGLAAVTLALSADSATLQADADGNVASYSSAVTTVRVTVGGVDDTFNWTLSITPSTGVTASLVVDQVQVAAMSVDSGWVTVTAARSGFLTQTKRFSLVKARSSSPMSGPVSNATFAANSSGASTATAGVRFNADGTVSLRRGASTSYVTSGNWCVPTTDGIGSSFWVRAILTGGATPSVGTLGAWVSLSAGQTWQVSANASLTEVFSVMSYQIAGSSGGSPVVATGGTITLLATFTG